MRTQIRIRKGPLIAVGVVVVALVVLALVAGGKSTPAPRTVLKFSASLDPGTQLYGRAPNFTLTDQFDKQVSMSSFRGKVVLLAFNDAECTTICPLTTTAMVDAKRMLGAAGSSMALLGVNANPNATALKWVRAYSEQHGMTNLWDFATGSKKQLQRVWHAYHIEVAIDAGQIDHTPALYMINPQGRLERLYLTNMSYASVTQQAQIIAREASKLLPGHPAVHSHLSYRTVKTIQPTQHTTLPLVGHGTVKLGPGSPRLVLFFASWDQEVMDLKSHLDALNAYTRRAAMDKLPPLLAIDEGSVEPSSTALPDLLAKLPSPLRYPVAIDNSGRVADGYGVQDEPWMALVSQNGTTLWWQDISTSGWPSTDSLLKQVKAALHTKGARVTPALVKRELAGSPPALAKLHSQAGEVIGGEPQLAARIRALRGYPIVVNIWASWCGPCRAESTLMASASARYGRQVAFLGADLDDNSANARAFLSEHRVSYPSYPLSSDQVTAILPQGIEGPPTTVFINAAGHIAYVQDGEFQSQGTLDLDIQSYALGS